jgi:hypothetical protein
VSEDKVSEEEGLSFSDLECGRIAHVCIHTPTCMCTDMYAYVCGCVFCHPSVSTGLVPEARKGL